MEAYETRLEAARRVAEQERLVAVWRGAISGLTKEGQPTDLAEKMLQLMECTLARFRADLAKLVNLGSRRGGPARAPTARTVNGVAHCGRSPRSPTARRPVLGQGRSTDVTLADAMSLLDALVGAGALSYRKLFGGIDWRPILCREK